MSRPKGRRSSSKGRTAKPPRVVERGAKAPKATPKRGRAAKYPDDAKITLLAKENPKREGSKAHKKFALYETGMTVGEFIAKGGNLADVAWDARKNFISVAS